VTPRDSAAVALGRFTSALDRAAGVRPIPGNTLTQYANSPTALAAMLDVIASAQRWIHFENYIIRDDATGRRFGEALAARARAGVKVRVLYDGIGSFGTSSSFWHWLSHAGAEVRGFNPPFSARPLGVLRRDHRKLVVADGRDAMLGGICIGNEWAGNPARGQQAWRDTMLRVRGPAAAALDETFARVWRRAGPPLPDSERDADPEPCGPCAVRVIEGEPDRTRAWRVVQMLAAAATERLWITDAYLVAPATLFATLVDAARDGVDVRLLLPGTSDIPVVRAFTHIGYRELLEAGIRIFEWTGPMLHAKTTLCDRSWVRVGSSNLNVSSLVTNYELDAVVENEALALAFAEQFRRDLAHSREVVLVARKRLPPRLERTPAVASPATVTTPHKRSVRELRTAAVIALRQVAGGVRRQLAGFATLALVTVGTLLLLFPRVMSIAFAAGAFSMAFGFGWYVVARHRWRVGDDVP
jgi:cardiolipin synthase